MSSVNEFSSEVNLLNLLNNSGVSFIFFFSILQTLTQFSTVKFLNISTNMVFILSTNILISFFPILL